MSRTIEASVEFERVTPELLYDAYLDPKSHSELLGAPVTVGATIGAKFAAFGGVLTGRILDLMPGRMIVQTWRGRPWRAEDADSILILNFAPSQKGARIDFVHANIPAHAAEQITGQAWDDKYWKSWRAHLNKRKQ